MGDVGLGEEVRGLVVWLIVQRVDVWGGVVGDVICVSGQIGLGRFR
jgi:hypothetical protein